MPNVSAMFSPVPHLFDAMPDPRTGNRLTYSLPEILLAALCAVLCGCRSCEQFARFTEARLEFLRRYLPYSHGAPSHDTFSRLFRLLPPAPFARLLAGLAVPPGPGGAVAIDGKALRGSADPAEAGSALMTLCAFATETGLALGQVAVEAKSNEIPALAELIRESRAGTVRETQLYLLGDAFSAAELATLSRGHWSIENRLHWVLDVSMGEDACRARREHAAENLATLRRVALNAIRRLPGKHSVPLTMLDAMLKPNTLTKLLDLALNS